MSDKQIKTAIKNAVSSLAMEGMSVDEQTKKWGEMLLKNEITMNDYLTLVKNKAGVSA